MLAPAIVLAGEVAGAQGTTAPWQRQLMPWESHSGQPRPWRADARLAGRSEPGYPDDFPVAFPSPDSARGEVPEVMWVRVTAYDPATDLFLGILLNQPFYLHNIQVGDNVVFRAAPRVGAPATAVGIPVYSDAGWPRSAAPAWFARLRDGIRAYRNGGNGHVENEIRRCIGVLAPVVDSIPAAARKDEAFVAHFVLGRCLAEAYETRRAIDQFRAAIAIEPADLDSHMALLAELSVLTHQRPGTLPKSEEAEWERSFVDELAVVRSRFATDRGVAQVLSLVFDPSNANQADSVWKGQEAKLQRVGYAVFRWKQR